MHSSIARACLVIAALTLVLSVSHAQESAIPRSGNHQGDTEEHTRAAESDFPQSFIDAKTAKRTGGGSTITIHGDYPPLVENEQLGWLMAAGAALLACLLALRVRRRLRTEQACGA